MTLRTRSTAALALTLATLTAPACGGGAATTSTAASAPTMASVTASDKECPPDFAIDDAEDNNNQVLLRGGRSGYWYTFVDKAGSTITPPSQITFLMSPGGAHGSLYAARMMGKVSPAGQPLFAGLGFSFTDPKAAYDASAFSGVSFYAKVGPGSTANVRLKLPDANTDPAGKACSECFNDFGTDLTLTGDWQKYVAPFAAMKQMEGWGAPHPAAVDSAKLFGLQWQVTQAGASYDVWVDDVRFTGCP
jgi:endoglucanase